MQVLQTMGMVIPMATLQIEVDSGVIFLILIAPLLLGMYDCYWSGNG